MSINDIHFFLKNNKKRFYEFAIIGNFDIDINLFKSDLNRLKIDLHFEYDIEIFTKVEIFTKYYKYDFIFIDFIDEFALNYHINPRIYKNGLILFNNSFEIKNLTYEKINNNIYQKINNNEIIDYDPKMLYWMSDVVQDDWIDFIKYEDKMISQIGFEDERILFEKNKIVSIPVAGGVGETIILLTVLEEILIYSKIVMLYIDVRFHVLILRNFKKYEDKLILNIPTSYFGFAPSYMEDEKDINVHIDSLVIISFFRASIENFKKFSLKKNNIGIGIAMTLPNLAKELKFIDFKFCGISFGTKTSRDEINISIIDLKEFILSKKDTIFIIFQYKYGDYEEELELIENDIELKDRVHILEGLDVFNDLESANTFFNYFDYFISVDNSSLFQFAMSGTDTYFLKKVNHEFEIASVNILQKFDENNKWLYFENVKMIFDENSYESTLELLFGTIEDEQYNSNKKSFWASEAYLKINNAIQEKVKILYKA